MTASENGGIFFCFRLVSSRVCVVFCSVCCDSFGVGGWFGFVELVFDYYDFEASSFVSPSDSDYNCAY